MCWLNLAHRDGDSRGSRILHELADFNSYTDALHAVAYGGVTGKPVQQTMELQVVKVALAVYSAVSFASIAGRLSAYLLR
ncbi:MAG: hypothetical protein M3454_05080 [Actinomycetota bacterium]|nr:hypothetical protein [Actinomycetota bacterium]